MQLDDKTDILEDGSIDNLQLSTGQKKRLALIIGDLENRDICVFDEWAADQDPQFREYFYETYLPELKKRGKTILAITHDDRYYHKADRIYKMEYGQLIDHKVEPKPRQKKR
jgi:putative ATP-binding cassette transporter